MSDIKSNSSFDELRKLRRPYYIMAPDYERTSAGVRAMHLLCHFLNQAGQEAYIETTITNPRLRTPKLTPSVRNHHRTMGINPIAVYPEIVFGNPLKTPNVVRYILNHPGLIFGPEKFPDADLLYFFNFEYTKYLSEWPIKLLKTPLIDRNVFHPPENNANLSRQGSLVYQGRGTDAKHSYPDVFKNAKSITKEWPSSHQNLADLLRSNEKLYACATSSLIQEALACGCPVIMLETPYNKEFFEQYRRNPEMPRPGIALDQTDEELARAKSSIHEFFAVYQQHESTFVHQLYTFINETQALDLKHNSDYFNNSFAGITNNRKDQLAINFPQWQRVRHKFIERERQSFHAYPTENSETLHLVMRLSETSVSLISETLDSLPNLIYQKWFFDIISPLPAPGGIEDVINHIGWHQVPDNAAKQAIDTIVAHRNFGWILELPPGSVLDPLYFCEMPQNSLNHENTMAFFVDDNIISSGGTHAEPRFKPGINPEWLMSTDLAGPLCVRRDAWNAIGGASQHHGSPWFSQLLRIAEIFGWSSIKHIPDVLISYTGVFPSDTEACLLSLIEHLQNTETAGKIVPVTGQSWRIQYPLHTLPVVSIGIISQGQLDLLLRCFNSIIEKTSYPSFEIIIVINEEQTDTDLDSWLLGIENSKSAKIQTLRTCSRGNYATRCNAAVEASLNDFILLISEDAVIIQEKWLEELLRTVTQPNVSAVSPCLIRPGTSLIENAGYALGLNGLVSSPYQEELKLGEYGYLDCLRVARDVSALPSACMLVRRCTYLAAGGMDDIELGNYFADVDLCLRLRRDNHRLIFQPTSTVVYGEAPQLDIAANLAHKAHEMLTEANATQVFSKRWLPDAAVDNFFNPNLSLAENTPTLETAYQAQWQYLSSAELRILARPLPNAQGTFRITSPLRALSQRRLASECVWPMEENGREFSVAELLRLSPDTLIVQHYLTDKHLAALNAWHDAPGRPFIVYALDDLVSDLPKSNPFFKNMSANTRGRLKYALERCDRLVASTDFLAETYRHFCSDIRVVPNRLEQEIWLPLQSRKNTSKKPRIGWAGGTTHQGDLLLLKEVIEQTQGEADWIFFGMCPSEIRPLLAEYHPATQFADYPAFLAALNLDIAVAPLAQLPFNQGKSNLRLLEYGILGIPVVCTDIEPYRNSPACRVTNAPEAWIEALRERIYDANARKSEGAALRQWVQQHYLLENHLDQWLSAHLSS